MNMCIGGWVSKGDNPGECQASLVITVCPMMSSTLVCMHSTESLMLDASVKHNMSQVHAYILLAIWQGIFSYTYNKRCTCKTLVYELILCKML